MYNDLCTSGSAIPTNNQISNTHNHLYIQVLLAHTCNIFQTCGFDKILLSIYKHGTQQRSQFQFLKMEKGTFLCYYYYHHYHDHDHDNGRDHDSDRDRDRDHDN